MAGIVADLTSTVRQAVEDYADGDWLNARGYAMSDTARQIYAVLAVPEYPRKHHAGIVVMARVVGDQVIVEHDISDRPLWEALVRAGIPREKIICTYAGEKAPEM